MVQVLDNLKYQPTQAQQERHLSLMKRRSISWSELETSPRWQQAHQQLATLQDQWLEWKAQNA